MSNVPHAAHEPKNANGRYSTGLTHGYKVARPRRKDGQRRWDGAFSPRDVGGVQLSSLRHESSTLPLTFFFFDRTVQSVGYAAVHGMLIRNQNKSDEPFNRKYQVCFSTDEGVCCAD